MSEQGALAALIPVKAFSAGKTRLRSALDDEAREGLAEHLAAGVVEACRALHPHVVCDDDGVAAWATSVGATVIRVDGPGLNRAVRHGVASLATAGFGRVLIAHGDIADPSGLEGLAGFDGIVLVPDLALAGTNVLVTPTDFGFSFSYGENSFARHLSEAERSGLPIHVVTDAGLGLDLDDPDDLEAYRQARPTADTPAGGLS
ncbi:MAG: 2-phospho-L-lactate guanylyltransferase [Actinomycetota bacterium]